MTWRTDPRTERTFGPLTLVSQTNDNRKTAHLITFKDGRKVRVLPDDSSGRYRFTRVSAACEALAALVDANDALVRLGADGLDLNGDMVEACLLGQLHRDGLTFERVGDEPEDIGEWLARWLKAEGHPIDGNIAAGRLIGDLRYAGWTIRRAE